MTVRGVLIRPAKKREGWARVKSYLAQSKSRLGASQILPDVWLPFHAHVALLPRLFEGYVLPTCGCRRNICIETIWDDK